MSFGLFSSRVDSGFCTALNDLKLKEYKLDDKPKNIFGSFSGSILAVSGDSFGAANKYEDFLLM